MRDEGRARWRSHAARAVVVLLFILHPSSFILSAAAAAPPFFEPTQDFYKARGVGVKAAWSADRTALPAGGELTATLTVTGATNPREVVRPDLRKLDDFRQAFEVADVPAPPPAADAKAVTFAYKLRPRTADVAAIPALKFVYVNPAVSKPPTTWAKALPLSVTPAAPPTPPAAMPLEGPEELFQLATGPDVLRTPLPPAPAAWLWLALLGPVAGLAWYVFRLRLYPDAAALAHQRRSRAARVALRAIAKAEHAPDPAAALADAVRVYLGSRFPLPPHAVTPGEVGEALTAAHAPVSLTADAVRFLERCDAARFAPAGDGGPSPADTARSLIAAWEAA